MGERKWRKTGKLSIILRVEMNQKRIIAQVIAAILLYTVISLILEKEYTQSVILRELGEGLIFGIIYGLFIWIREKWKNKRSE
jgi:hypothetical protein